SERAKKPREARVAAKRVEARIDPEVVERVSPLERLLKPGERVLPFSEAHGDQRHVGGLRAAHLLERDEFPERGAGASGVARARGREAEGRESEGAVPHDRPGSADLSKGLLEMTRAFQGRAQVEVCRAEIGCEAERLPVLGDRLVVAAR